MQTRQTWRNQAKPMAANGKPDLCLLLVVRLSYPLTELSIPVGDTRDVVATASFGCGCLRRVSRVT